MSSSRPGGAVARFRLPVEPPSRHLLIASLSAIAGSFQLLAWALARLPGFFVVLGTVLIVTGLGFGLAALIRHYRLRWIAYVGPESLTISNGSSQRTLRWEGVAGARVANGRLVVLDDSGTLRCALPVDRTRAAHQAAGALARAIEAQLAGRA